MTAETAAATETAGTTVAKIARLDPMTVDIDVPPILVNGLHVGDAAQLDVPAVGVSRRGACIRAIAPLPNATSASSIHWSASASPKKPRCGRANSPAGRRSASRSRAR